LTHLDEHPAQARETDRESARVLAMHPLEARGHTPAAQQLREQPLQAVGREHRPEQQQSPERPDHAPSLAVRGPRTSPYTPPCQKMDSGAELLASSGRY